MVHTAANGDGRSGDELAVERALVERARTDRTAFAALYRRHVDAVFGFAFRRCGSREVAEEATSATFERALRSIDGFEWREGGLRPWLLRIASNEVADIYRRQARPAGARGQLAMRDLIGTTSGPAVESAESERDTGGDITDLHTALDRLPERYRAAISLRYLAGLSASEAAAELECTNAKLAVTLHRALKALRVELTNSRKDGAA